MKDNTSTHDITMHDAKACDEEPYRLALVNAEERIAKLEETIYFQEQSITELNDALTKQQFQIDEMEKMLKTIKTRLRAFAPLLHEGGSEDGPPPHYGTF